LEENGVEYRLMDGEFRHNKQASFFETHPEWNEHLRTIRPGLTQWLRWTLHRCLDCAKPNATKPRQERLWCEACFDARTRPVIEEMRRSDYRRKIHDKPQAARKEDRARTASLAFTEHGDAEENDPATV
jgi:hypothetical protein